MEDARTLDKRESVRVVTDNTLISAGDLSALSLNARKLFYVAVAQCRKDDSEFYEYETTPAELAEMWGIDPSNVYREAKNICLELMKVVLTIHTGSRDFEMVHLFQKCRYQEDAKVIFKINGEMAALLLGLKKNFTKPLLWDFMKMRSPYSIAIWHLMQREMKSFKPMINAPMVFDLTIEELREATGCQNKLKQTGQFKAKVLDLAVKEIRKNCLVSIRYENLKSGRTITGFRFTAESYWAMDPEQMTLRTRQQARKGALIHKRKYGKLTPEELEELVDLTIALEQMSLEDFPE